MGNVPDGDESADVGGGPRAAGADHPNLFLLGSGVFPSVGTANPTLTIAALAPRAVAPITRTVAPWRGSGSASQLAQCLSIDARLAVGQDGKVTVFCERSSSSGAARRACEA